MILYDIIWYYMILYDTIWYYMILYDTIWYYMIHYDIMIFTTVYLQPPNGTLHGALPSLNDFNGSILASQQQLPPPS
jgi:hypothetical protein